MAKKSGESCLAILIKMTFLLTMLAILAITGIYFAYNKLNEFFNRGGTIVVPDFRGRHLEEIMKSKPSGIEIIRRDEKHDAKLPKDYVIAQFPEPYTVVKPGKQVMLSVSLGLQKVIVPDLIGKAIREVDVALLNAQLVAGNRAYVFSKDVLPDRVVGQSPMPSEEYGINQEVDLLISLGTKSAMTPLPNLSNIALEAGKASLKSWGFNLGKVYSTQDKTRAKFRIISTNPPPYATLRKGDTVNILISSGIDMGSATKEDLKRFEVVSNEIQTPIVDMSGFKALTPVKIEPPIQIKEVQPVVIPVATPVKEEEQKIFEAQAQPSVNLAAPEKEISYMMPDGFMPKELKFIHLMASGRKQIYVGVHKPLELVKVKVPIMPNTKVQVYINDIPIEELKLD